MEKKIKRFPKWQIWTAVVLIIVICISTVGIQISQIQLSADDYENKLQNQAAQYLTDANDYISQGAFSRALDKINSYFDLYPEDENGYLTRASIYTGSGEYDKALTDMTHAIELNQTEPDYYLQRGCLYILLNDYAHAQEDFEQVVELNNKDPYALLLIAQIYYEKQQYELALNTYDKYQDIFGSSAELLAQEAYLYSLLADNESATEKLQEAYDIAPNKDYAAALAQAYASLQNYDQAVRYASFVLNEDTSDTASLKLRADSYYLLADYKKALKDYTTYLAKIPKDETCAYQQCICYLQLEQYDALKEAANELLSYAKDPDIIENTQALLSYL